MVAFGFCFLLTICALIAGVAVAAFYFGRRYVQGTLVSLVAPPAGPVSFVGSGGGCPVCGTVLSGDSPEGLCPQCLLQCAMAPSDPGIAEQEEGATTPPPTIGPPAPTPEALAPFFPDLEIIELLGQGGMGAVYKARQRKLDRLVALKILPAEWGCDPAFTERFTREARTLARLNHAHVVAVHDFGEAGGHCYLIMEYVDGANLRQFLAAGRLQPWQALPIVNQVCDALQYAHEQGVVHRDVKPENILLDRRGRVKIADFGLAKLLTRSRAEYTLTGSRQVMGTFDYMSPEQRMTPQAVDHRADIYSLGVVFYEMLTGELPLGRFAPPSEKALVDARLDEVIFRALERDPDRRYQRISAVKDDVQAVLRADGEPEARRERRAPAPLDRTLAQLQTRGPAVGLFIVAALMLIQTLIAGTFLFGLTLHEGSAAGLLLLVVLWFLALGLIGTIGMGALKLARCESYEWAMAGIILCLLPLGYHWPVSFLIGIWALIVVHREAVREAFTRNKDKARNALWQRAVLAVAAGPAPQPATPFHQPVRGVFRSMMSMFLPGAGRARPAPVPVPPRPFKRRRVSRLYLFAIFGFLGMLLLGMLLLMGIGAAVMEPSPPHASYPYSSKPYEIYNPDQPQGLTLEYRGDLTRVLNLNPPQSNRFTEVLKNADHSYLELEHRHTRRQFDPDPRFGQRLNVTISPFPEELSRLEEQTHRKLLGLLDDSEQEHAERLLPKPGELFLFGKTETHIEIWQDGRWWYWHVERSAAQGQKAPAPEEGNGGRLPRIYQRFWDGSPLQ